MGFHVSTLHNLPINGIVHFVHVLDISSGAHAQWISENLQPLAASFGKNAGLVTGPMDFSQELYKFLFRNLGKDFSLVEGLLHSATCLVISEGHLAHTRKPVYLIPVATPDASESTNELISTLIRMIASAIENGQLQEFVKSLGASKLELEKTGGFFICNLRRLNTVLELKPNVAGLGFNLNALIEKLLPPAARSI